jgi:hypothetical protein
MKNMALSLAVLLAMAGSLSAQVKVQLLMDHDQFLPGEQLPVKVRVSNNSGQTLRFGDEAWLSYSVEDTDGTIVMRTGEAPTAHNFDVIPSQWASTGTDLAPYFKLTKPGRYTVVATVKIRDWRRSVTSAPLHFDVITGTRFWEQAFGMPQAADNHNPPEVRKYILQKATTAHDTKLYFRLTDADEVRSLRVFSIGPMMSFSDPQMRVDQASNLHLLYQQGARAYAYLVINLDGDVKRRETYVYVNSAPRLKVDEHGEAVIVGGVRRFADNDVPNTRNASLTNDIPQPVP